MQPCRLMYPTTASHTPWSNSPQNRYESVCAAVDSSSMPCCVRYWQPLLHDHLDRKMRLSFARNVHLQSRHLQLLFAAMALRATRTKLYRTSTITTSTDFPSSELLSKATDFTAFPVSGMESAHYLRINNLF